MVRPHDARVRTTKSRTMISPPLREVKLDAQILRKNWKHNNTPKTRPGTHTVSHTVPREPAGLLGSHSRCRGALISSSGVAAMAGVFVTSPQTTRRPGRRKPELGSMPGQQPPEDQQRTVRAVTESLTTERFEERLPEWNAYRIHEDNQAQAGTTSGTPLLDLNRRWPDRRTAPR
jgi:hypothetical protein